MTLTSFKANMFDITMDIPAVYRPQENSPALKSLFSGKETNEQIALNNDMREDNNSGYITKGGRNKRSEADAATTKKSQQAMNDLILEGLINDLRTQIANWETEIEDNNAEITQNNAALSAIDDLKELMGKGELDPNNPEHRRLLEQAGIDPNLKGEELEDAINKREKGLISRNEWLRKRNKDLRDKIDNTAVLVSELQSGRALETSNGRFTNPQMEKARQTAEQVLGEKIDPNNMSEEQQQTIRKEALRENHQQTREINHNSREASAVNNEFQNAVAGRLNPMQEAKEFESQLRQIDPSLSTEEQEAIKRELADNLSKPAKMIAQKIYAQNTEIMDLLKNDNDAADKTIAPGQ